MKATEAQKRASKKYRETHKAHIQAKDKEWKLKNPDKSHFWTIRRRYKITFEEYTKMLSEQKNFCAICKQKELSKNGKLYVDHCHTTGKVRGLLCLRCNTILGMAKDNVETLDMCIKYLNNATQ